MSKNTLARYTMVGNWAVKDANGKAYIGREVDNFITCQNGKIRSLEADLEVMDNRVEFLNSHNKDLAQMVQDSHATSIRWDKLCSSLLVQRNTAFMLVIVIVGYELTKLLTQ